MMQGGVFDLIQENLFKNLASNNSFEKGNKNKYTRSNKFSYKSFKNIM